MLLSIIDMPVLSEFIYQFNKIQNDLDVLVKIEFIWKYKLTRLLAVFIKKQQSWRICTTR